MTTSLPTAFDVAEGRGTARGVIVEIDPSSGLAVGIEAIALSAG